MTEPVRVCERGRPLLLPDRHLMNPTPSGATYPSLDKRSNKVTKEYTSDIAQMCIFIWTVFTDMTAKEELLTLLAM